MKAYENARYISSADSNFARKVFMYGLADKLGKEIGRSVEHQSIPIPERFGDVNFILSSNHPNPILLTAHYDAYLIGDEATTPGANDNGSGVGVLSEAAYALANLPVDFVFFGGEEIGCMGAKEYLKQNTKSIRGVVNLDTCGSGGDLGLLIPERVHINRDELRETDQELNDAFKLAAEELKMSICRDDVLATGDHGPFLEAGIPATTLQGEDMEFFGIYDGQYMREKMIMHTESDTMDWVDPDFLSQVVQVVINGMKSLCDESSKTE